MAEPCAPSTSPSLAVSQPLLGGPFLSALRRLASAALLPLGQAPGSSDFGEGPVYLPCCGLSLPHAQGGAGPEPCSSLAPSHSAPPTASASQPPSGPAWLPFTVVAVGASWAPGSTEQPGQRAEGPAGAPGGVSPQPGWMAGRRDRIRRPERRGLEPSSSVSFPDSCTKATMQAVGLRTPARS